MEVNPLVTTPSGDVLALDAKVNFDANALFRHPDVVELRDLSEEDPKEVEASKFDLNYIALDGNVACMVNGAGLAMATMDIIKHYGGSPANFLDVGGGATEEQVENAFRYLVSDDAVKAILVNIFGGIMKCDVIATGIVNAARKLDMKVPLVVRLEGTNVEQGKKILADSGLALEPADSLAQAAEKIVQIGRGSQLIQTPLTEKFIMSVLVNKDTRLVVQGITGSAGSFHTTQCMEYGTNVVAGVTPGKGGQKFQDSVPVFDTVKDAVEKEGANVAAIYVPPPFAADSILGSN